MSRKLDDALERLASAASFDALEGAVTSLRDTFEVEHVVYHAVRSTGERWGAVTYDPGWVQTYIDENFQAIDPVVLNCFRRFTPADWKTLDWSPRAARTLLAEGIAHGIGNQGLSLPIRGPNGQFAVFTLNDRARDDEWAAFAREAFDDLLLVAHYVNERALALDGTQNAPHQMLSPRETDALTLLAAGRSRAQAAEHLRISENTLRVYIESARFKLGALNTVHAVANAMSRGLICV
ncbi:helix-turn-helix transcriptional regulator [Jannaschia rubra]|uniref:HTH-type quorum sensing-dependent transcriptional regulator VjbR n=1 Tax=Jannaschia rubra TaxID=282197 RepID=A0A0M6XQF8_9RHOB|nr:autoinducer binding domain-containing protein [Jannaschia rubra]CTQ33376.1 HTH-type quorum sensing-dependent transcriptional regulator VjbR [Jannaschia rubra]SFG00320.1 DNA-binding transcriptional regulator, CsgD family [Jannaschia rubra]